MLFIKVMDTGRIQSVIIATGSGNVVYERFYERMGEHEKAELRASLAETADTSTSKRREEPEFAARYRDGAVAGRREGDLTLFAVGNGEYDELSLAEVLRTMCLVFRDIFKKSPSEALLHDNYGRMCLIVDEMIYEGMLDKTEPDTIQKSILMKAD